MTQHVIGPDGSDIADRLEMARIAASARARTAHGRDPFQPDYGMGLRQVLGNPNFPASELARRAAASFSGPGFLALVTAAGLTLDSYRVRISLGGVGAAQDGQPDSGGAAGLPRDAGIVYEHIPDLDEDRWYWLWEGLQARQIITETFADELARHPIAPLRDADRQEGSMLDALAYQNAAIAYYQAAPINVRRAAVREARRLNNLVGSERAYSLMLQILQMAGWATYDVVDGRRKAVNLFFSPPEWEDEEFRAWFIATVAKMWPLDLDVGSVTTVQQSSSQMYAYAWHFGKGYSGWPEGL